MAAPTIYRDTDASAPVLSGQSNALIDLLKACLVDGYGSQPAAGWTEAYTGTALAAFQQGGGAGRYVRVEDSDARLARIRGYESMSAISTGTGDFPTVAQFGDDGLYVRKSITADATARPWILLATDTHFYLLIYSGVATTAVLGADGGDVTIGFGELLSPLLTGDTYASFLIAASDTSATSTTVTFARCPLIAYNIDSGLSGHYMARSYTASGTSIAFGKCPASVHARQGNSGAATNAVTTPQAINGAFELAQIAVIQGGLTAQVHRGYLPGVFGVSHTRTAMNNGTTVQGHGAYEGEEFLYAQVGGTGSLMFQTSGGW